MTLRELRMWHWRQMKSFRRAEVAANNRQTKLLGENRKNEARKQERRSALHKKSGDFHLSAVQALNDAVWATCDGFPTAEQDHADGRYA